MAAMPPPGLMSPPPSDDPEEPGMDESNLDALRKLRSEFQGFQSFLTTVRTGKSKIETFAGYVRKTCEDIEEQIVTIHNGDSVAQINNLWEQIRGNPLMVKPEDALEAQQQLHYLDMLDSQIRQIIFLIGYMTIPQRLNKWLSQAWPGYYVPFHVVFEDELPIQEDRQRVLNYLAWSPKAIHNGIVDPISGLIYRYSENTWMRLLSVLWLVLAIVAAGGIVAGSAYIKIANWPLSSSNLPALLSGFAAVLVGVIVHAAVGSAKRTQSQGGLPPVMAMRNILLVIDSRIGQLLLKVLLSLIGFLALVFASGIGEVTLMNSFLVGYALDSFIELFGTSLEQRATSQVANLKQQMGL